MAEASPSFNPGAIRKKRLQNTLMVVNRLQRVREQRYISLSFTFKNFTRLEPMCEYSKDDYDNRFHYTLFKDEKDVFIRIITPFNNAFDLVRKCYVSHREFSDYRVGGNVEQTDEGMYGMTFPLECVKGPEFLVNDDVHVQIRFNRDRVRDTPVRPYCGEVMDKCHKHLYQNLMGEGAMRMHDFAITAKNEICFAPKGLCAARSSLYRDYLTKNPLAKHFELAVGNIKPNFQSPSSAMYFLIAGVFEVPNDTQSVLDLLTLSQILGIPSLKSLCSVVLKDDLDMLNAQKARMWGDIPYEEAEEAEEYE